MELASATLHSLSLAWTVSSAAAIFNYTVYWSEVPSGGDGYSTLENGTLQLTIDGLLPNTAYSVTVEAAGLLGKSNSTSKIFHTAPKRMYACYITVPLCHIL